MQSLVKTHLYLSRVFSNISFSYAREQKLGTHSLPWGASGPLPRATDWIGLKSI